MAWPDREDDVPLQTVWIPVSCFQASAVDVEKWH